MNERIKELAEQAANELADLFSPGFFDDRMVNDVAEINKKFAELIVQECARIARATPFPDTDVEVRKTFGHTWDMAASEAGREIVNHFGVNSNVE
jgi:hypothetical protein